jgi:tetratricopeptide (TPR) repeat protein
LPRKAGLSTPPALGVATGLGAQSNCGDIHVPHAYAIIGEGNSMRASLIGIGLMLLICANAFASSKNDRNTCNNSVKDQDARIAACTSIIAAGKNAYAAAAAYNNRGNAYYHKHDYDLAIADYDQAIKLNPQFAEAYSGRGNALDQQGDLDRALADLDRAIQLNPRLANAYVSRGNVFCKKRDFERAIGEYTQALKFNTLFVEAYYGRGNAFFYKRDYERATADYDRALRIDPKYELAAKGLTASKFNDQLRRGMNKGLSL